MPEQCTQTDARRKRVYRPVKQMRQFKEHVRKFVQNYVKGTGSLDTYTSFKDIKQAYEDACYVTTNEIHLAKEVAVAMKEIFPIFKKDRTRKGKGYRGVELRFP